MSATFAPAVIRENNDIAEQIIKVLTRRYKLIHIKDGKAKDFICVKDPAEVDGRCDWLRQSQFYEVLQISSKLYDCSHFYLYKDY